MEAAGLAFGVANLMDPLIRLGRRTVTSWQRASSFGEDVERLRVRFKREQRQIEAIRGLLLTKARGLGAETTIFEQFEDFWQAELLDELRQLRAFTRDLEEIEGRYHIFAATHQISSDPPTEDVINLTLEEDREGALQKAATKSQLLVWGLKDGKRAAKLVDDLHDWVQLFKQDVEMCLWKSFKSLDTLRALRENTDIAALGLADAVGLREILIKAGDPSGRYELQERPSIKEEVGNVALGTYGSESALVEYKVYDPNADADDSEQTRYRVCQLVALLHQPLGPEAGFSLRVLPCTGYYIEPSDFRYSFVYVIPRSLAPKPLSLLDALSATNKRYQSTIRHRLKLAYTLALSVYQLHLVGWVHKSLRSENIVFFPTRTILPESSSGVSSHANSVICDALVDRRTQQQYAEPWLLGFEFARVISDESKLATTDTSVASNIYRHPERWNSPTHRFGPTHDIYALGTVLLEIGIWRPLTSLSESGFARAADAATASRAVADEIKASVCTQIRQRAASKLPYSLGGAYCDIVLLCLGGSEHRLEVDEADPMVLQKSFREHVVDRLARLVAHV